MDRAKLGLAALLNVVLCSLTGCCLVPTFWNSSSHQAYDVNLGKIGTGEQVITSPNAGKPWQGDRVEQNYGF